MASYLDSNGLLYFWQKIKATFALITDIPAPSSTTPTMDGTGSTGSGTTYARADHVHPTDTSRAPTDHASTTTIYGKGTSGNYGHVKLSDSTNSTLAAASGGVAATPKAVKDALDAAKAYTDGNTGTNTTYTLSKSGSTITLTGSDGSTTDVTDSDTKALGSMTGILGLNQGGTGVNTLGAGLVFHASSSSATLSIAGPANIVNAIGDTAVNRAAADASGNNISDTYAKKSDITGMYKYKGSVASAAALPSSGQSAGDVYNIEASSTYGGAGMNVAWNGTEWDPLGEVFSITSITNAEIDTICAS